MTKKPASLADRYDLSVPRIFLSGTQALVRLVLMQQARDQAAGLNTAGLVTGYRGSPLGGVDQQFHRAAGVLGPCNIVFQPAINEDLAATALWGAQQAEMRGEGRFDGVFGIWYGKGPGVDRTGDVFRHANAAGTSKNGGVLVLMGDDHAAESSTCIHQSEFALMDAMMPVLHPAGVQEILDYGLYGLAMSRYCGAWVGLKCVHDNVESTAVIEASAERAAVVLPAGVTMPPDGLNIRPRDDRHAQEIRTHRYKLPAAIAFARANGLDRMVLKGGASPRIGIITTGKSYLDTRQALDALEIDEAGAAHLGIRLLKLALVWPIDPELIRSFAAGLDVILVVEEKRAFIETQVKDVLYGLPQAPRLVGKRDDAGAELLPSYGVLEPGQVARTLAALIKAYHPDAALPEIAAAGAGEGDLATRIPYFCAGCPHNSSTVLPDGARGYAGIGCHWMVQFIPERLTEGATHMGGEGANWIGEAPFSTRAHVFQNMGDGTYNHSGLMAIRGAAAAGVNITYKILFNDAVAMTGGQAHDGQLTVPMVAHQVRAAGVDRIAVVSDEPEKHAAADFPPGVTFHHRDTIQPVQRELMETKGASVLIYDQTCAAEKRRRRKRGAFPDPARRVFINERVCEGCGDCGVKSNCVAVMPVETEFGRKRQIDQSACNKDFSCLKGFCPSFVTVEGGELIKGVRSGAAQPAPDVAHLPVPHFASALEKPWSVLITGIGGTGVVTIGHVLGMAAHLDGKAAAIIDMAGLSQKNGAVVSHLRLAQRPEQISAVRIPDGHCDLLLGCDMVTAASARVLAAADGRRTRAVINDHEIMPGQFTRNADLLLPVKGMQGRIAGHSRPDAQWFLDTTGISTALLGDSIAANMFALGFAWQQGLVPVAVAAILEAITLNGAAVKLNTDAFNWGRVMAAQPQRVLALLMPKPQALGDMSLEALIDHRSAALTQYQNAAYAARYRAFVTKVAAREAEVAPGGGQPLTRAVATYLYKLMAYKDEYEVARLYTDGIFQAALSQRFVGGKLTFHLAPPLLAKRDPATGLPKKQAYGPWMLTAFKLLARMKVLRGSVLDPFGYSAERRGERALIGEYEAIIGELLAGLTPDRRDFAAAIATFPERIRGYGHVKDRHLHEARQALAGDLARWRAGEGAPAERQVLAAE